MKKNFVLDTNVLLHDPNAISAFEDNDVIVPIHVIEEIDTFKKQVDELGRNARTVSRKIDAYLVAGSLHDGVPLPGGGTLRVLFAPSDLPDSMFPHSMRSSHQKDDYILAVAVDIRRKEPEKVVVFVTMDTNLRIRANALGLDAENYEKGHVEESELYTGHTTLKVSTALMRNLRDHGKADLPEIPEGFGPGQFLPNLCLTVEDEFNPNHTLPARVAPTGDHLMHVLPLSRLIWGIKPKSTEQLFAMNLLLDDRVKLVTLVGKAGTGKTLIAVASGLHKVTDEKQYERLLVSRSVFPLGKDIGFLPGSVEEKLNPWMQPIHDSIDFLMSQTRKDRSPTQAFSELRDMGFINIEPLTYIRGRSIPHQFMIVDEAQNLTPHEVKTILTRAGEDTKIVLTGDPYQIDHPYLDSLSNGLAYTLTKFQGSEIAGTMTLVRGERSALAEAAANRL